MKKKLFSYCNIWSNNDIFYNKKLYSLKYKILNHLTEDYVRVFLTPIFNIDNYLPEFSSFDTSTLFRENKKCLVKLIDVSSLYLNYKENKENNQKIDVEENENKNIESKTHVNK